MVCLSWHIFEFWTWVDHWIDLGCELKWYGTLILGMVEGF